MSVRLSGCPKCSGVNVGAIKIHNPETTDLNSHATLKCEDCKHEWEGKTTSKHTQEGLFLDQTQVEYISFY